MLMTALRSRPDLAHFRIQDLDCRPEPCTQSGTVIGCKSRIRAGDQKNAVDAVRQEVGPPLRGRRVIESGDYFRMMSPELKGLIEARPTLTHQLGQSVLREAEVQPQPGFGLCFLSPL